MILPDEQWGVSCMPCCSHHKREKESSILRVTAGCVPPSNYGYTKRKFFGRYDVFKDYWYEVCNSFTASGSDQSHLFERRVGSILF